MSGKVKVVTVHRAGDIGDRKVESCTIQIGDSIDQLLGRAATMEEAKLVYSTEATQVADALYDHLSQAVFERVLLRMMERKVNSNNCMFKGVSNS